MNSVLLTVLFISGAYAFAAGSRSNLPPDVQRNLILPDEVTIADITLYLYTKANQDTGYSIASGNFQQLVDNPDYDPSKMNVFIVHGLTNNYLSPINTLIKSSLLQYYDINVFVVDWSRPAGELYTFAKDAVPIIANFLADFIKKMYAQYQLSGSNFRCIGHSLGAHLCGDAGSDLNGEMDYIMGLDPAGPLFFENQPQDRLDPTDAKYVEVIHTNAGMLGYPLSTGHADFYPNGGTIQNGCGLDPVGQCSHDRAYEYYAESINNSKFIAAQCTNYFRFAIKQCDNNNIALMGQFMIDTSVRGDYYLDTSYVAPYALGRLH